MRDVATVVNGSRAYQSARIVECSACEGSGVVEKEEMTSYHKREYDVWNEVCQKCDGDGRMVRYTVIVEVNITIDGFNTSTMKESQSRLEKMMGRTTADIYKIGRGQ
jgi:DnaJ-class molecular chaperone